MDGSAVKEIAQLEADGQAKTIHIEDEVFSTRPLHRLPLPERRREEPVDILEVGSLSAVVDYLEVQKDGLEPETHFVHIESPTSVRIVGSLLDQGGTNQRHTYLTARLRVAPFGFGGFAEVETMVVALQSRFARTHDRERLCQIVGNLVAEESIRVEDDGVTQRATKKTGVARREDVSIENPFHLAPRRTFREIDPPESPFVLRVKQAGDTFAAALFEADGGAWEDEAVARMALWFEEQDTGYKIIG